MAIPGFTADESVGPTLQVYRSPSPAHEARGLRPQNLDDVDMADDDGEDVEQDEGDLDDDGDAGADGATEDSSSGDA